MFYINSISNSLILFSVNIKELKEKNLRGILIVLLLNKKLIFSYLPYNIF